MDEDEQVGLEINNELFVLQIWSFAGVARLNEKREIVYKVCTSS